MLRSTGPRPLPCTEGIGWLRSPSASATPPPHTTPPPPPRALWSPAAFQCVSSSIVYIPCSTFICIQKCITEFKFPNWRTSSLRSSRGPVSLRVFDSGKQNTGKRFDGDFKLHSAHHKVFLHTPLLPPPYLPYCQCGIDTYLLGPSLERVSPPIPNAPTGNENPTRRQLGGCEWLRRVQGSAGQQQERCFISNHSVNACDITSGDALP